MNLRQEVEDMVARGDVRELLERASEFHGHYCHKVAYGVKASVLALRELGTGSAKKVEGSLVVIVDSPGPFCNGIQFVTGLTLGHSDLVIRDLGKLALTLVKSDGTGVRISLRPEFMDGFSKRNPELAPLLGGRYGTIPVPEEVKTPLTIQQLMEYIMQKMGIKEEEQLKKMMEQMAGTVKAAVFRELAAPEEEMFSIEKRKLDFSEYAPVCQCTHPVVVCESCNEMVFEPYIRSKESKNLCLECAGEEYGMMAGGKIKRNLKELQGYLANETGNQ